MNRSKAYQIFGWVVIYLSLFMPIYFLIPGILLGILLIRFSIFLKRVTEKERYFYEQLYSYSKNSFKLKMLDSEIAEYIQMNCVGRRHASQFTVIQKIILKRIHFLNKQPYE